MATVDQPFTNQSDSEQEQQGSNTSANSSFGQAPQVSSGESGTTTNQGGGTSGAPTGGGFGGKGDTAATQSGAYPNLSQYMSANQNWTNQQGQGLGQEIAGNLNQQGQQLGQANQQAIGGFENQGNTWAQNTQNASNAFASGLSNPYGFTNNNPTADQTAGAALNAQYQGPQSVEAANPNLQQNTQNYVNTAQQTQTEGGRFNLLQQMFGGNNYTGGQQTLDNALLQTNPQQMQQLQGANQQATQVNQNLTNAQNLSGQQSQAWNNLAAQTQQQAAQNLNQAVGNQYQGIQNNFTQQQAAQQQAYNAALAGFQSGDISQQLASQVGLNTSNPSEVIYNVSPSQYLTQQALTAQNSATNGEYQNMQALGQLGQLAPSAINGQNQQYLSQYASTPATLYNSSNDIGFNNAGFQTAITNAANAYQAATAGNVNAINSAGDIFAGTPTYATGTTGPGSNVPTNYNGTQGGNIISNQALVNSANIGAGGTSYAQMGLTPDQQITAQMNASNSFLGSPQITAQNNTNALGYLESLVNQLGPQQAAGELNMTGTNVGGQNEINALSAIQNLMAQNQIYDPTATLNIGGPTGGTAAINPILPSVGTGTYMAGA